MYHVIRYGPAEDNAASLYLDPIPGFEKKKVSFMSGAKLGPLPPLTARKRVGAEGDMVDYMSASPATLVFSPRFREALASAGIDNVDYYPLTLIDESSGKKTSGHQAANVVGLIDCMDRQASVFTPMAGFPAEPLGKNTIFELKELHLAPQKIQGAKLFRLFGKPSVLIVHESVKEVLQKSGMRGFQFKPAEGYAGV
ncbi:imm11 family protein [Myxococcus xanthus]|uniref:Immunity MXAN-0049 protein domain-containing protein n=1 Tax=Myxococcus xanthus TaxID=34 RepID=A0AAE6FZ29_MYXXA|nr:DUF1629 domain-containing protein [Myxococcus xanthus]QDE67978.1 hypothetical protein BHS09_13860 [Myxococcus xanthus]QDE75255.1 hypothetical protein BHS08_13875 [Myxococcus xanthus]QDE82559.1 hypothetical protein BHS07_13905 [Myxococcus xanthus]